MGKPVRNQENDTHRNDFGEKTQSELDGISYHLWANLPRQCGSGNSKRGTALLRVESWGVPTGAYSRYRSHTRVLQADLVGGGGVYMSYEDTIQAITRELRDAFPNDPRATQQTAPRSRTRRKKTRNGADRLLWLMATLITIFMAVAATALFAR